VKWRNVRVKVMLLARRMRLHFVLYTSRATACHITRLLVLTIFLLQACVCISINMSGLVTEIGPMYVSIDMSGQVTEIGRRYVSIDMSGPVAEIGPTCTSFHVSVFEISTQRVKCLLQIIISVP
jgi:hypothetical protein